MWTNISSTSLSSETKESLIRANSVQVKRERSPAENGFPQDRNSSRLCEQNSNSGSPLMRYKHAVCSSPTGYIYIHGGRSGNLPLDDDVWRFDPHQNTWLQLETSGQKPPNLQEHTLVEFNEQLYLFGGQVSTSNSDDSFWRLDLISNEWRSLNLQRNSSKFGAHLGPKNRRGHSAIIYANSMYIFGGFEDFRGSSAQLWEFNFLTERWELRNLSSSSACHPEPRHGHSAIVHEDSMFIYGGLSNLKPLADLWRWSWRERRWFKERTRGSSPGQLHGHTAIQAFGSMFVFGGERNGRTSRSLWRLNLSNLTWQKIRAKGPQPNPTTWHGAIANPLSILDESNYIIEGDPEFLLKNIATNSLSENCSFNQLSSNHQFAESISRGGANLGAKTDEERILSALTHSKSSIIDVSNRKGPNEEPKRSGKRKLRLSFLRRQQKLNRPSSSYELKKMHNSASAIEFASTNRHSVSIVAPSKVAQAIRVESKNDQLNVKILDNLDTDIKKMFQQALSPADQQPLQSEAEPMIEDRPGDGDSVSPIGLGRESVSLLTSNSQYQTAIQANSSMVADMNLRSQRTSYACTTPPSEMQTLCNSPTSQAELTRKELVMRDRLASNALLASGVPLESGFHRRDNRPKSEIVQSLIDRADARIKHLYTPFFNQHQHHHHSNANRNQALNGNDDQGRRQQAGANFRASKADKSKRHTIHQTMTYYNLYFSEDKNSSNTEDSSPPTSDESSKSRANNWLAREQPLEVQQNDVIMSKEPTTSTRMVRDDLSSSTIRETDRMLAGSSNGVLIGVHGGSQVSDQQSDRLSFGAASSTDSRTICAELADGISSEDSIGRNLSQSANLLHLSSLGNALTGALEPGGRDLDHDDKETIVGVGDNTSLSFSIIAEFEEDDMLQYSSPTEPIMSERKAMKQFNHQADQSPPGQQFNESSLVCTSSDRRQLPADDQPVRSEQEQRQALAHKSASSGYDSMSGFEQQARAGRDGRRGQQQSSNCSSDNNQNRTSVSDTQEDSSVRTDSSLGFSPVETSPEQSATHGNHAHKKMRPIVYQPNAISSIIPQTNTIDSLAATSSFECPSDSLALNLHEQAPGKSLPSSPADEEEEEERDKEKASKQTRPSQRKVPLISRSKFFGSRKSKNNRYWQLCMFVIGGKQEGSSGHGIEEPITIWRLYI